MSQRRLRNNWEIIFYGVHGKELTEATGFSHSDLRLQVGSIVKFTVQPTVLTHSGTGKKPCERCTRSLARRCSLDHVASKRQVLRAEFPRLKPCGVNVRRGDLLGPTLPDWGDLADPGSAPGRAPHVSVHFPYIAIILGSNKLGLISTAHSVGERSSYLKNWGGVSPGPPNRAHSNFFGWDVLACWGWWVYPRASMVKAKTKMNPPGVKRILDAGGPQTQK
jgi:hypothetical protein